MQYVVQEGEDEDEDEGENEKDCDDEKLVVEYALRRLQQQQLLSVGRSQK